MERITYIIHTLDLCVLNEGSARYCTIAKPINVKYLCVSIIGYIKGKISTHIHITNGRTVTLSDGYRGICKGYSLCSNAWSVIYHDICKTEETAEVLLAPYDIRLIDIAVINRNRYFRKNVNSYVLADVVVIDERLISTRSTKVYLVNVHNHE